ncbi:MAG: SpaA isopeptide-forming pilin-related protein [Lachnospiraceae bacterium]
MSTIRIMIKKVIAYLLIFSFFAGMVSDFSLMEVLAATDATVTDVELWINGVQYQEGDQKIVYDNATFVLRIKWKVSNGVAAGDEIVIPLPDCIAVENRANNVLSAFGNPDAGRYDIRDGYLYIHPSIAIDSNMEGSNEIEGVLASAYRPQENVETKTLHIYDKNYTMDVQKTSGTNTLSVSKGHGTMDEQGNVKYTVTVTSTGTNKNIVLTDVFNDSAYMELTGEVTVQSSTGNTVTGTCSSSGSGFTYTLQPDYTMANGEKLTFEYTVKVKDSAFVDKDGQQLLNTAKVTSNNLSEGTTYVDRLDIRKSYVSKNVQANADGTYTWTIDVNSGVKVDIGGFVLQDILPSGFIPTTDAVITDSSGATVATISKNDFNNGFEYTFPSPSADSYQITYTTKVDKNYLVDYNPIDGTTYSNRAIIKKDDVTKGQYDRGVHIPGVGSILSKSAQSFKANGDKGIIHWVSTINIPDPSVYDMSGFQYADNVNMSNWNDIHQTFVDGTVVVKLNGTEIAQGTGEDQWEFGYKNLNRPYGQDDQFMIQFKDLLVGKTGTLTIEYDTNFNLKEYEATISNEASIYDGNKNLQLDKKTGNYSYSPAVKKYFDGYDSEHLIFKWKVKVAIKDTETIRISDILPENQVFCAGTMTLRSSQYYDGSPIYISDSEITTGNDGEHNTLTLNLDKATLESKEDGSTGYTWLWYETEIEDKREFILGGEKTYTNVIEIKDQDGNSLGGSSVTTGSITPPESTILYKYMEIPYDGYHGQYLYYAIDVNTAGLTLLEGTGQLTLTDRLGKAISYRSGSFVIYTDSARTNKMDSSLYSMTYDRDTNTMTIKIPDGTPCYISYQAKVLLEVGEVFSSDPESDHYAGNEVELSGELEDTVSSEYTMTGSVVSTKGEIKSENATVTLFKFETDAYHIPVEGAYYSAKILYYWDTTSNSPKIADDAYMAQIRANNALAKYDPAKSYSTGSDGILYFTDIYYDYLYEIREVSAPDGYSVNSEPIYLYFKGNDEADYKNATAEQLGGIDPAMIKLLTDEESLLEVNDDKIPEELPQVKVSKRIYGNSGAGDIALSGAELQILDQGRSVITWASSGAPRTFYVNNGIGAAPEGEIVLEPDKEYTLHEVSAPYGYSTAEDIKFKITLSADQKNATITLTGGNGELTQVTATVNNVDKNIDTIVMRDKHSIYLNKINDDNENLAGATLEVYTTTDGITPDSKVMDLGTTPDKVDVTLSGDADTLEVGKTYILHETAAPAGYDLAKNIAFKVNDNYQIELVGTYTGQDVLVSSDRLMLSMKDHKLTNIEITKVDAANTTIVLAGAKFDLYDKSGTTQIRAGLSTGTGVDGKLTFTDIPYGEYIIRETTAPDGYEIIVQYTPVTIGSEGMKLADGTVKAPDASNTVHITLTNSKKEIPMARLEITKVDSVDSSIKLSGAEFTLTGISTEIDGTKFTGTTGANGKAVITNIPYGTYQLTETKAPTGYHDTPSGITGDNTKSSNLINASSTPWEITFNENAVMDGKVAVVSATVTDAQLTGSLKVTKKDSRTGDVLSEAKFTLKDSGGKYYQTNGTSSGYEVQVSTDVNGTVTFNGLPYGEYILTEVTAPNYYQIDESTRIQSVTINSTDEKSVTVTDTRYTFSIGKTAIDGTEQLSGAELAIYTADDATKNQYSSVSDVDLAGNKKIVSWTTTDALKNLELGKYLSANNNRLLPGTYELREITAPAGYCAAPAITFKVSVDGKLTLVGDNDHAQLAQDQLTLTMKDDHTGAIRIVKLDANISNGPIYLDEVRFKVYRLENGVETEIGTLNLGRDSDVAAGTKSGDEYVTDLNGEIVIKNLPDGTYVFEETATKTGYLITTPKTTVVLERSKIISLSGTGYSDLKGVSTTIYNTNSSDVKGAIRISKKDKGNDAKLAGATFELYRGNELIISGSSDQEGNIVFENIPYGDYRLVETGIPKDYKVTAENITATGEGSVDTEIRNVGSDIEIRFTLDDTTVNQHDTSYSYTPADPGSGTPASGGVIDFNVYNERKSRDFVVKKTDSDNGNLLQNAEFTLYTDAAATHEYSVLGNVVKATTDSNGLATFSNLKYGTYYMKETKTPDYYVSNNRIYEVVVDDTTEGKYMNAATAFEVTNDPIRLYFDKKELGTTTSLAGARLKLTSQNGNITREFLLTDVKMTWDFKLASEETASTDHSTLCPGTYTLEETGVPDGYRKAPTVTLRISDTGVITVTDGNSHTSVNVQTLTLYDEPAGKILVTKVDADNSSNYLKGVEFRLYKDNGTHLIGSQTPIATKVTNDNGQVSFEDLSLGSYILEEVAPPAGYLFSAADGLYFVDVVRDDVSTTGVKENETQITVTNKKEVKLGNILLTKKDSETLGVLADAEFQLIATEGGREVVLATAKTDSNGQLVFRNVALGSYIVRETKAPDGYDMDRMDYDVTITERNCTTIITVPASGSGTENIKCYPLEVKNTQLKGSVVIKKSDSKLQDKYLAGAQFELYYKDDAAPNHLGSRVDSVTYTTGTGSDLGIIRIENLLFGDYVLKEIMAPDGYEINATQEYTEFTIDSKTTPTQVEVENDIKYGSLTITKYDKESYDHQGTSGTKLRGAVYALFSDVACLEEQKLATGITNETGEYKFDQLPYGTYYLKELVAPENYKVDPDVKTITIPDAASVEVLSQTVTDETAKGKLKIIKLDSSNDAPLKDAKFKLVNSNGEIINTNGTVVTTGQGEFSTNAEGILEYSNLPYGVYTLEETQSPEYYIKDQDSYSVLINKEAETEFKVLNHHISIEISKRAINEIAELKGATLAIKDLSGNIVVPAWESDSNKVVSLGVGAGQLKPGTKYVLTELERPAGYLFAKDIVFTVSDAGEITIDSLIEPAEAVAKEYGNTAPMLSEDKHTIIMYDEFNQNFFTEFYISKRERSGSDELAGATLEILKDGTVLKTIQTTTAPQKITVGVGKDLEHEQEYVLHEANAPKGYAIAEDIRFVVHRDGKAEILSTEGEFLEDDHLLIMRDRKKSATEQSIRIRKFVAGTTDYVKGAELAICDQDGNVIVTWISDEAGKNVVVDFTGATLAFDVDYILTEKMAPEGYEKAKDILFSINEDGTMNLLGPNGQLDAERRVLTMFDQQITTGSEEDSDEDDGSGESSKDPRLVDTGDHTPILRYIIMMILSLLVMLGYAVEERKDKDLS